MKTVIKYPGAKNRIVPWILNYIPEHDVYLEPFAGSLAVFFNKRPSHIETINDIDNDIINFFRVLRDYPDDLIRKIELTPFGRSEYIAAFEETDDLIEKARRFLIRCWQGFGNSQLYQNGFKSGQQAHSPNPARAWVDLSETLKIATERLKGVQIECLPALDLIARYNTPDVFMYLDPPYLPETRKNYLYKHEMSTSDHEELLKALLKHPGKILISSYENELYNDYLRGWQKVYHKTTAECGIKRIETLYMNYGYIQMSFF